MLMDKRGCRFSIGEQKYEEVWIRATGVGGGLFTFGFVVDTGFRILFLASWYPHRGQPTLGNFVERHAHAVALGHRVEVLYLVGEPGRATAPATRCAPGMARSALTGAVPVTAVWPDDLELKVLYRPGKGNG